AFYRYAGQQYKTKPETALLFTGLAVISIFRIYYILHGPLDLSPDEAHYWEWSRRLDLSYYSKGPMMAYLIYTGTSIFGDTVFGIRIMAVIFSALSSVFLFKLVNLMYVDQGAGAMNKRLASSSALLFQVIPLFAPFGVLFTIDSPFVFFWIISLFFLYKSLINEPGAEKWPNWLLSGFFIGLGLLTKYTMAFFYICGFLLLLLSEKRYLLKTFKPYAALAFSLVIFSPVIIWNIQHDWVTLRHTAGQAHVAEGIKISLTTFFEFMGTQIGVITPVLFGLMIYSLFRLRTSERGLQSKFLFYFSVPVVCFFLLKSLQAKVQANWAMTGYITGIIAVTRDFLALSRDHQRSRLKIKKVLFLSAAGLALFVTAISHYPSVIKLPPELDPSARLRGWNELGKEINKIYDPMSKEGHVLIFSDSYQVSSELAFYVKGHLKTYSINLGRRMNQYDLWPDINSGAMSIRRGKGEKSPGTINGIFVKMGDSEMPPEVARAFDRYEKKVLKVYDKNYLLREYSIFICYNFKGLKTEKPETY
ncbi:MAG: glycosyltransferase family 39 protein, partial [Nitrospirae bacterium]|nr:glycosyltransferase family 39 protein [Nitrospirota bacterium]